jgi:alpha-L-rhamnosidase
VYVSTPKLRLDVTATYANGSRVTLGSNATAWRWAYGPITRAWIGAENIDARQALPLDWASVGFDASAWAPAVPAIGPDAQFPGSVLVAQREAPTRVQGAIQPQTLTVTPLPDGGAAYVFGFGREFQGWVTLAATGPRGANVTLLFCGSRDTCDATTQPNEVGGPDQSLFTLAGLGNETW